MVSSLTEELPAMLHAFEVARRRKESLQHPNHQNANQSPRQNTTTGSEYALNTPPDTPSRSTMDTSFYDAGTNTPDSTSYMASPVSVERPKNKPRKKRDSGTPLYLEEVSRTKHQLPKSLLLKSKRFRSR